MVKSEDTVVDFQVKYTDGWVTIYTMDDHAGTYWVYQMFKRRYKNLKTRFQRRKENVKV